MKNFCYDHLEAVEVACYIKQLKYVKVLKWIGSDLNKNTVSFLFGSQIQPIFILLSSSNFLSVGEREILEN